MPAPWKKSCDHPRQHIKKQRRHFAGKGPCSQRYGFSSSHVRLWELNHNEGWALNTWCFQTVVLEKTLESPMDSKEIKLANPKGHQPWTFIGRTDAETEALIFGHLTWSADSLGKTLILRESEGKRRRGRQRKRRLDSITESMDLSSNKFREIAKHREAWCAAVRRVSESRTRLGNWITTTIIC